MEVFAEGFAPREVQFAIVEQNPTMLNVTLYPVSLILPPSPPDTPDAPGCTTADDFIRVHAGLRHLCILVRNLFNTDHHPAGTRKFGYPKMVFVYARPENHSFVWIRPREVKKNICVLHYVYFLYIRVF